jgi:hypothetical protein
MTPSYKFYVVFHYNLIRDCYKGIPEEKLKKHVTFMAVNGKREKVYDPWFEPMIMYERKLPIYNPFLQYNRFCEGSVCHHMYNNWNLLVEPYDFVGTLQYDMRFSASTLECIDKAISNHKEPERLMFYYNILVAYPHLGNCIYNEKGVNECLGFEGWNEIIQMYNFYFKTNHTIQDVAMAEVPLYYSFMVHKKTFGKIMTFAIKATSRIFELLHYEVRHLGFHLERLMAILIYMQKKEGIVTDWIKLPDFVHDESLKDVVWNKEAKTYVKE